MQLSGSALALHCIEEAPTAPGCQALQRPLCSKKQKHTHKSFPEGSKKESWLALQLLDFSRSSSKPCSHCTHETQLQKASRCCYTEVPPPAAMYSVVRIRYQSHLIHISQKNNRPMGSRVMQMSQSQRTSSVEIEKRSKALTIILKD